MTLTHETIETGALQVNCQLLGTQESGEAVLIDPGGHANLLLQRLTRLNLRLTHIINTHGHFDHVGAVAELQERTGVCSGFTRRITPWCGRLRPMPPPGVSRSDRCPAWIAPWPTKRC